MDIQEFRKNRLNNLLNDKKKNGYSVAKLVLAFPDLPDASYISQLKTGHRSFGEDSARNIEKALGLPLYYFEPTYKIEGEPSKVKHIEVRQVPVLNYVQAGDWRKFFDNAIADQFEPVTGDFGDHAYGLIIEGDSMKNDFSNGDIIIVDPDKQPIAGSYVVAMINKPEGNCVTFKKYRPRGFYEPNKEYFELVSSNNDYESYDSRYVDCNIIGVAIEHKRKL